MAIIHYITGASGSGKSTAAWTVARDMTRPGSRVETISTDVIRAGLRAVVSKSAHPDLWAESFDVPEQPGDEVELAANGAPVNLDGFLRQCEPILRSVEAAVTYALSEGWDIVVEGVHVIPGEFKLADTSLHEVRFTCCQPIDSDTHLAMFSSREGSSRGGRPADHYHRNLPRIERVQQLIVDRFEQAAASDEFKNVKTQLIRTGGD